MIASPDWRVFPSREALAEALAEEVADTLSKAIARRGEGFLAISGGSTPQRFFAALSKKPLEWNRVVVTLVDERFVPESSDRSNAALVRQNLLTNEAAQARFVGLYRPKPDAQAAARSASQDLAGLPWPLDAVVLGMGTDGHTASFFPGADNLAKLLAPQNEALVEPTHAEEAGEERLTLPLARLLEADFIALHIEGEEKRAVLEDALKPAATLPVSAVFRHSRTPLPVYWTR